MMLDARSVPDGELIRTDVCIAGAGIAGITLAREFIGQAFNVCLLESGGLGPDRATQSLYWGENLGYPYYPLDTHGARAFGGTSHRWHGEMSGQRFGVRLRPLDPLDFEKREWVPHSGWPITRSDLEPYYERAHRVCRLGPYDYDPQAWQDAGHPLLLPVGGRVETTIFQFGARDQFHGEYREEIERAPNITTVLYANVVGVNTSDTGDVADYVSVATLTGKRFCVAARLFVLAMGGVENPRILLLSDSVRPDGLGNEHGLVGRYFMEHPHVWSGLYVPADTDAFDRAGLYRLHDKSGVEIMGKLALSERARREEQLLGYCVSLHPGVRPAARTASRRTRHRGIAGMAAAAGAAAAHEIRDIVDRRRASRLEVFLLNHMSEQAPNPESRVTLGTERDRLGMRRAQLDWRISELDVRTIIRAQELIDEELRRAGLGHLEIDLRHETPIPSGIVGGYHQMGTTRMHADPKQGVVDADCRVHPVSNLFVAGSSVFPTVGYANPVLTLVALAIRLADHVKELLA